MPVLSKSWLVLPALFCLSHPALADAPKVSVLDKSWDTGAGMYAYTEFELSGEPLAQGLGLNLDVLDPDKANKPDPFDFAAGIDSYELSEEAMYAVNYKSGMGPHLANGPINTARAGKDNPMEALGKRVVALAAAAGLQPTDLPENFYPISFPLAGGTPEYGQAVDVSVVATTQMDILTHKGNAKTIEATLPAYMRDYKTLRWDASAFDKTFTPQAVGMEMLKDVLWAQDYLRAMHHVKSGAEIDEIPHPDLDKDADIALGDVGPDGFNGVMLTEITWDKLTLLSEKFGYDGKTLGATIPVGYDASKSPVWFPNKVAVELTEKNGVSALGALKVEDGSSTLRSAWMMLWPLAELYGYADHRPVNKNQRNSFKAVFDGDPFPSGPDANLKGDALGSVKGTDPFSLTQLLLRMTTDNLQTLHFNEKAGTLVDSWVEGKQSDTVTAFDAAYVLVGLHVYQRAIDALPVGYQSASSGKPLGTPEGKEALALMKAQVDFMLSKMMTSDGLLADSYTIGKGASSSTSVATQFAGIRGFSVAFQALGDETYKKAARDLYLAVEKNLFDAKLGIYSDKPGTAFEIDPWTAGAVSAGIRELMLNLVARTGESNQNLSLAHLAERYTAWFQTVGYGMQRAEWLNDTGEHMVAKGYDGDINENGIKSITYAGGSNGTAPVMASKIKVEAP